MQPQDEFALSWVGPELVVGTLIQAAEQGVLVDVEDEDTVEQVDESRKVPRASAEEGDRLIAVGGQRLNRLDTPDVVLVRMTGSWCAGLRISLVCQIGIAVDGLVAAELQLLADR